MAFQGLLVSTCLEREQNRVELDVENWEEPSCMLVGFRFTSYGHALAGVGG